MGKGRSGYYSCEEVPAVAHMSLLGVLLGLELFLCSLLVPVVLAGHVDTFMVHPHPTKEAYQLVLFQLVVQHLNFL